MDTAPYSLRGIHKQDQSLKGGVDKQVETLKITVVGKDLFKLVEQKMELAGINTVNTVSTGMLGNLTTLTFFIKMREDEVIKTRKRLLDIMADDIRMMPLYVHGDWMRIFVIKPMLTSRSEQGLY